MNAVSPWTEVKRRLSWAELSLLNVFRPISCDPPADKLLSSQRRGEFFVGEYVWFQLNVNRRGLPPAQPRVARIKQFNSKNQAIIEFSNMTTRKAALTSLKPYTVP